MSNLAAAGVHPKIAQTLARHSSIKTTMDRYTHLYEGDLMAALNKLPDLSPTHRQIAAATRTYDQTAQNCSSPDLSVNGGFGKSPADSGGGNDPLSAQRETPDKSANYRDFQAFPLSERDGARTRNHRIDSPVLYPIELRARKSAFQPCFSRRLCTFTNRPNSFRPGRFWSILRS